MAEQKKASNTARSSRCLGTARRRGSQAGGAPPRIRPINDKKLLPSDMNGCKFPTTYRQEELRKNMIAREGGTAKEVVLRFLQLTSCLRLVFYGCSVDRTVESADVGTMT